jgi:hypothetical protein
MKLSFINAENLCMPSPITVRQEIVFEFEFESPDSCRSLLFLVFSTVSEFVIAVSAALSPSLFLEVRAGAVILFVVMWDVAYCVLCLESRR